MNEKKSENSQTCPQRSNMITGKTDGGEQVVVKGDRNL